jgi:hypothetical protein
MVKLQEVIKDHFSGNPGEDVVTVTSEILSWNESHEVDVVEDTTDEIVRFTVDFSCFRTT